MRLPNGTPTLALAAALCGCASLGGRRPIVLLDGTSGLENFDRVGAADWTAEDGAIGASRGGKEPAYLVSRREFKDFRLRVEFWASEDANSGVFLRCQDPARITDKTCYEANIFDRRPEPAYATGAIVGLAAVAQPPPKAGGRWNTYEITAKGSRLVLVLNGRKTVELRDSRLGIGPIALQWVQGTIRFRRVELVPL